MLEKIVNWPLLTLPDANGRMVFPSLEDSVRQSMQIILRTRPGERLMRPRFGGGLENMLHEQNTLLTRRQIRDLVTESLEEWERRIILDRVDVLAVENSPTTVRVEIAYRLIRTNAPKQMGITMVLET